MKYELLPKLSIEDNSEGGVDVRIEETKVEKLHYILPGEFSAELKKRYDSRALRTVVSLVPVLVGIGAAAGNLIALVAGERTIPNEVTSNLLSNGINFGADALLIGIGTFSVWKNGIGLVKVTELQKQFDQKYNPSLQEEEIEKRFQIMEAEQQKNNPNSQD